MADVEEEWVRIFDLLGFVLLADLFVNSIRRHGSSSHRRSGWWTVAREFSYLAADFLRD